MATIVKLPTAHPRRSQQTDHPDGATILFFTGVRYVRDSQPDLEEEASDVTMLLTPISTEDTAALAFN